MNFGVKLEVWGDYALFTRPEMKTERVSYDVMTPSAARAILEAIYFKPAIRWVVDKIIVLKPIRFENIRRNELGGKIPERNVKSAMKDKIKLPQQLIEQDRVQRAAMLLRDVSYVIQAHFEIIESENNLAKHLEMFKRRALKGQCAYQPYMGCREFPAFFKLIEESPTSDHCGERDLGWMLHDIDFQNDMTPRFFKAKMIDGVISVPPFHSLEVVS